MAGLFDDLVQAPAAPPAPQPAASPRGGLFDDLPLTRMVATGAPAGLFDDLKQQAPQQKSGQFDGLIDQAAARHGIPPALLRAQVQVESSGNPDAVSPVGARGLMQLMPKTAASLGVKNAFDPQENLSAGAKYMRQLYDRFGSWEKAAAAFNGGPTRLAGVGGDINRMPPETRAYVAKLGPHLTAGVQDKGGPAFLQHARGELQPQTQLPPEKRNAGTDIGVAVAQGVMDVPATLGGIADILTGGAVRRAQQGQGIDMQAGQAAAARNYSPQMAQQQAAVEAAKAQGFGPMALAMMQHPLAAGGMVARSLPTTVTGGMVGRAVAPLVGAVAGAGVGEGLMSAGGTAAQIQASQEQPLTGQQRLLAAGSGALTGVLGAVGGRLAQRLGLGDPQVLLAGGVPLRDIGLARRLIGSALSEAGQEIPQSSQEQMAVNLATGRPLAEGVGAAAAQGGLLGGVMGAVAGGVPARQTSMPDTRQTVPVQSQASTIPSAPPAPPGAPAAPVQMPPNPVVPGAPGTPLQAAQAAAVQGPPQGRGPATDGHLFTSPTAVPFAGSRDIAPLLDNLDVQGEARQKTLDLLRPDEQYAQARRRGVVSLDEQQRLADLMGLDGAQATALGRKLGEAFNAEQTLAVTGLVRDRLSNVLQLQQRVAGGMAGPVEQAQFVESINELGAQFAELMGARAEAGRAMAAYRRQVGSLRDAQSILESVGGAQGAEQMAKAIGEATRVGGIGKAAQLIRDRKPGLFDYYYRAALLSGVRTHAVNLISNTAMLGNEAVERSIAAGIGGAKRLATGGNAGQTLFKEPVDLLVGMTKGFGAATRAAAQAFKTGESAVLGSTSKAEPGTSIRPRQGKLEAAFSLPFRALGAEDALFANLNFSGELRALARQQAVAERQAGLKTPLSQRIEELVAQPTAKMIEQAGEHARRQTFNEAAGPFVQAINAAKTKAPWLNVVVPFVRTPTNLVKAALRRTPAALAFEDVRADLKAGGARQERAAARVLWGSTVMTAAGLLAQAGHITGGGPDDEKAKRALIESGWRPYAIRLPDGTYAPYNRVDPFAMWLGLAADFATTNYSKKDAADVATTLLGSLAQNITSKSWVQGAADLAGFLDDPGKNAGWYASRLGGTMAQPFTLLSQFAADRDPLQRETKGFVEGWKYRMPGLREDLRPKLDSFGQPVQAPDYLGAPNLASPFPMSPPSADPVRQEAARIGWAPPEIGKVVTVAGKKIELDADQHREFRELAGRLTHIAAKKIMAAPGYQKADDNQKKDLLDKAAAGAHTAVRLAVVAGQVGNPKPLAALRRRIEQKEGVK